MCIDHHSHDWNRQVSPPGTAKWFIFIHNISSYRSGHIQQQLFTGGCLRTDSCLKKFENNWKIIRGVILYSSRIKSDSACCPLCLMPHWDILACRHDVNTNLLRVAPCWNYSKRTSSAKWNNWSNMQLIVNKQCLYWWNFKFSQMTVFLQLITALKYKDGMKVKEVVGCYAQACLVYHG